MSKLDILNYPRLLGGEHTIVAIDELETLHSENERLRKVEDAALEYKRCREVLAELEAEGRPSDYYKQAMEDIERAVDKLDRVLKEE